MRKGFTLLELMIALAVIAIIVAVAFPSLLRSRITSNEAMAIGAMRMFLTAEEQYKSTEGDGKAYASIEMLEATNPPMIAGFGPYAPVGVPQQNQRSKDGYNFAFLAAAPNVCPDWRRGTDFYFVARPLTAGRTGNRRFVMNASGVIRWSFGFPTWNSSACDFYDSAGNPFLPID